MPSHVLRTEAFPREFCLSQLEAMRCSVHMKPGGTLGDNRVRTDIRRSSVGWPDVKDHEIVREADRMAREINKENWNLSLDGAGEYQLTHYAAGGSGAYHTHIDLSMDGGSAARRKLSFVVQLSNPADYAGGELRLEHVGGHDRGQTRRQGSIIVFPSWVPHSVTPLVRGERWSLVAWLSGPPLV